MPRAYPKEFRDDVVRVAQQREEGVTVKQVAKDFGVSESCLTNWLTQADRDAGVKAGPGREELGGLRMPSAGSGCWSKRGRGSDSCRAALHEGEGWCVG